MTYGEQKQNTENAAMRYQQIQPYVGKVVGQGGAFNNPVNISVFCVHSLQRRTE